MYETPHQIPFFVYGTLKRGERLEQVIGTQLQSRMEGRVKGFVLHNGPGFPYIVHSDDDSVVYGEVCVPYAHHYDAVLNRLDAVEGVPHHYKRETTEVLLKQVNIPIKCYIYVANTGSDSVVKLGGVIESGVWNEQRDS